MLDLLHNVRLIHTCAISLRHPGYIRFILHAITQHMCTYFCPGNPRQKCISPRLALHSQGRAEWIREPWLWGIYWLVALETIPSIPNAKSQGEIREISINESASFPRIRCIGFLGSNLYKPPFIPQYSGSTSQALFSLRKAAQCHWEHSLGHCSQMQTTLIQGVF